MTGTGDDDPAEAESSTRLPFRPTASQIRYWDYDPQAFVSCSSCGWEGLSGEHEEYYREVLDVQCGGCEAMLLVVPYPTLEETRDAAAAGNPRALAGLPAMEARAKRLERAEATLLRDPGELPEILDDEIVIIWDFETIDDANWQVLLHGETEIWRESAFFESYSRFEEVFGILRARYGARLREVRPSQGSEVWLYGDRLGSPAIIEGLNRSLRVEPPDGS